MLQCEQFAPSENHDGFKLGSTNTDFHYAILYLGVQKSKWKLTPHHEFCKGKWDDQVITGLSTSYWSGTKITEQMTEDY